MKIKSIGKRGKRSVRKCLYCGEEFSELNIKLRSGKGKFCSNECYIKYRKEHSLDIKEQNKLYQKKSKYNLDKEGYLKLFDIQNNKCAICGCSFSENKACVNHCHETNKVRGLLCSKCNTLLGMARDDINILQNAINYLQTQVQILSSQLNYIRYAIFL